MNTHRLLPQAALAASLLLGTLAPLPGVAAEQAKLTVTFSAETAVRHRTLNVAGFEVFYREAGPKNAPTLLLLHGFPTSSHMFRNLIPLLADRYHVIAPDLPGFGRTRRIASEPVAYTFDRLADVTEAFTQALGLNRYAIYIQDYGAPVGLRLASRHPERITAIITQNGNAYEEGFGRDAWAPIMAYWKDDSAANREALRKFVTTEITQFQYTVGVPETARISPDNWVVDQSYLDRPGNAEIQLDLFRDYRNNVPLYAEFQKYFREKQPALLAVWGKNDPFFIPAGARAFQRDLPKAEIHLLDAGHFALESDLYEIAARIRAFLARSVRK